MARVPSDQFFAPASSSLGDDYSLRLCEQIARWRFDDLPADVVHKLKLFVLDTLGVIGGAAHAPGIRELNQRLAKWESTGSATGLIGKRRYSPPTAALANGAALTFVKEDKPDAPGLATCWKQAEPARQLPNLHIMPIMVLTSEASYHAPYDHCTVKYLRQAGVEAAWVKLADLGIKGNSHVMMQEKNSKEIAAVIYGWLEKSVAAAK